MVKKTKDNPPKKYKSLVGKKINCSGQRMEIVTHYYDGKVELENKKGKIIRTHLNDL